MFFKKKNRIEKLIRRLKNYIRFKSKENFLFYYFAKLNDLREFEYELNFYINKGIDFNIIPTFYAPMLTSIILTFIILILGKMSLIQLSISIVTASIVILGFFLIIYLLVYYFDNKNRNKIAEYFFIKSVLEKYKKEKNIE